MTEHTEPHAPIVHEFIADGPVDADLRTLRGDVVLRAEPGTALRVELRPADRAGRELAERMRVTFDQQRLVVDHPEDEAQDLGDLLESITSGEGTWGERLSRGLRAAARGASGRTGQLDLVVVLPARSRVALRAGSGDVAVAGALARLEIVAGAGDLTVERGADESVRVESGAGDISVGPTSGDLRAKSGSGDLRLGPVGGAAKATTGAGDIALGPVGGQIAATTGSGDVDLAELSGEATITTGTGDITVRLARSGHLRARTGVGDVIVHVAPGTATRVDLATGIGERDVRLSPADGAGDAERTLVVEGRTAKGDLRVLRAEAESARS
jgi:hypothetical protein